MRMIAWGHCSGAADGGEGKVEGDPAAGGSGARKGFRRGYVGGGPGAGVPAGETKAVKGVGFPARPWMAVDGGSCAAGRVVPAGNPYCSDWRSRHEWPLLAPQVVRLWETSSVSHPLS